MAIYLGNIRTDELLKRLGIELEEGEVEFLKETQCNSAGDIGKEQWHCFDMPFVFVCGSKEMAIKVKEILIPHASKLREPLQLSVQT